jgi:hypothetical protein
MEDFLCLTLELFAEDFCLDFLGLDLERDEGWLEGWDRLE